MKPGGCDAPPQPQAEVLGWRIIRGIWGKQTIMGTNTGFRTIALAMALILGGALTACTARGPSATDALSLAGPVPADRTRMIIIVPSDHFALMLGGDVFVNGRRLGRLEHNAVIFADVPPGVQVVTTNTELGYDTTLRTRPGETVYLRIASGAGQMLHITGAEVLPAEDGLAALTGKRLSR